MRLRMMGIPVDTVTRTEAVAAVRRFLVEGGGDGERPPRARLITTPNPEMLVDARHDPAFTAALQSADLAVADGHGLVLVARTKGMHIPERVTGTDFVQDVAALAAETGRSVFLLGGEHGEGERAAEALLRAHPGLRVAGTAEGGALQRGTDGVWRTPDDAAARAAITASGAEILLVAFGHRKQETWLHANLPQLPSVRVGMGIGGAFNFLAGRAKRAPAWMRAVYLEWLWRLLCEPRRIGRIFKATVVFPLLALTAKN